MHVIGSLTLVGSLTTIFKKYFKNNLCTEWDLREHLESQTIIFYLDK